MSQLNSIKEAIEDLKQGKIIIVVDDEDRENEGDFIVAAEFATPKIINFMVTHGRGLVCAPLTEERCAELDLGLMVNNNTAVYETNFTVSVDLQGYGCTTGISASDRSKTIKALINPNIKPEELGRPGHIFPLIAKDGGVLFRSGHTEATVDLTRLAGLYPAGVLVEVLKEDGEMARLPDLLEIAKKFDLKIISIEDLIAYRLENESLIQRIDEFPVKTIYGDFDLISYRQTTNDQIHFALVKGAWTKEDVVSVRVMSSNSYYDLFSALENGETPLLEKAVDIINQNKKGAIIFINNVLTPDILNLKMNLFKRYSEGKIKSGVLTVDKKDHGIGSQIIKDLGIRKMNLLTRSPDSKSTATSFGLEIVQHTKLND